MGISFKRKAKAASTDPPAAAPAADAKPAAKPAKEKPAKPAGPNWLGEQVKTEDGKPLPAWVSSYFVFWWMVEGNSPTAITAGIVTKFGPDAVFAITQGVRQKMPSGKLFVILSKSGVKNAAELRRKAEDRQRKFDDANSAQASKAKTRTERKKKSVIEEPATTGAAS